MNTTSLVTGGAGFIGSHVVHQLVQTGHKVVVLDDLSGGKKEHVNPKAIMHVGSINDSLLVDQLFEQYNFAFVYHLAAYAAEGLSPFIRKFNYENNLVGSINLINAAVNHRVKCFVFTSSIAVYGANKLPFRETLAPRPEDPYGIAKYAVELDLMNAHKMFGLNYVIFRPHNVYGPNQRIDDKYRNVIGIFMNQILSGKPLTIFGNGAQTRAFSYIDDVAPYIANATVVSGAYNQIFNIGSNKVYAINDVAAAVCDAMGVELDAVYWNQRDEVLHAYADHSKFEAIFKPDPRFSLKQGLSKVAEAAGKLEFRAGEEFGNIEIKRNLPEVWQS